jgi:hypothetical protein
LTATEERGIFRRMPSFHYGTNATLYYTFNGRATQYGSRIASVMARYEKLKDDTRASDFSIRVRGQRFDPEAVRVYRSRDRRSS